ncbi:MAG: polysaccharide deacetylase family protein [Lachnospiraceae bacterium]|nr:polysaccharide deacetylase family protein [Lachnospiraceae bacterium]
MKKRIIALLSILCLMTGCFSACGKTENTDTTPTAEPTATVAPLVNSEPTPPPRGDGPTTPAATETPAPTAEPVATETPVPTSTTIPEPTKAAEVSGPTDLVYDFNDLTYNTSYGTTYAVQDDGSISLQFENLYQEIKLNLPQALDMNYCTGVTVKMQSEAGNLAVKLYDEGFAEVFVRYDGMTNGIADHELSPALTSKVAGIGLMACSELEDYSNFKATVYSVTFHMKAGYDSGLPAPEPTPFPVDPDDDGIWENQTDISWIDTTKPMIAFTFDDGPVGTADTAYSIRIQNALSAAGQHATFFYWGNHINSINAEEIKRAHELGFEIGNHTYSHSNLTELSAEKIWENVSKCAEKLTEITGLEEFLVRPPYLAVNATVKATVPEPLINCSIDSKDWAGATCDDIINTITSQKKDGAIVLMHETYSSTADAMEKLIPQLVEEGWQIVSVSELFKAKGLELLNGTVYNSAK